MEIKDDVIYEINYIPPYWEVVEVIDVPYGVNF